MAFLDDHVRPLALAGVLLVSGGMLTIVSRQAVGHAGVGYALLAGLMTTTYTIVDGHAVRLAPQAGSFIVWFFVFDGVLMGAIALAARRGRTLALVRAEGRQSLYAGLASLVTYGAALLALRWLPIGVASALRETGLVFGLVIARVFLHEAVDRRRALGGLVVAAGAMLVVAGLP
jgi:drug/metabolite transporter (DMT)-like permease